MCTPLISDHLLEQGEITRFVELVVAYTLTQCPTAFNELQYYVDCTLFEGAVEKYTQFIECSSFDQDDIEQSIAHILGLISSLSGVALRLSKRAGDK
jgi:hypothetical protein